MDPLGDPLRTRPIEMGWDISIEPYRNWLLRWIDNPEWQFVNGLVLTQTRTRSDSPEPLPTWVHTPETSESILRLSVLKHVSKIKIWLFTASNLSSESSLFSVHAFIPCSPCWATSDSWFWTQSGLVCCITSSTCPNLACCGSCTLFNSRYSLRASSIHFW